ncbi:tetratricopeptide repeat protein [Thalassotalea nanhaiensis]|uniref:Tetratricopeptide repeat protein n=1 Tax=Thalassotalea nanhaiensis TaxID=3065648 RepID=A0ABY9TQD9_9GAMM|nr:tetratricopeptide repeat protein [Colwelliaceae bacterium SQ345]
MAEDSNLSQKFYEQALILDQEHKGCEEARELFIKAGKSKHVEALYMLGVLSAESDSEDGYEDAYDWWLKAARRGHIGSCYNLGICHANGAGAELDITLAVRWFEKAAEKGHVNAQFSLARELYSGNGIPRDFVKAFNWMLKAAMAGHVNAMADVALMYTMGQGIDKPDKINGYVWALNAQEHKHDGATNILKAIEKTFKMTERDKRSARDYLKSLK